MGAMLEVDCSSGLATLCSFHKHIGRAYYMEPHDWSSLRPHAAEIYSICRDESSGQLAENPANLQYVLLPPGLEHISVCSEDLELKSHAIRRLWYSLVSLAC